MKPIQLASVVLVLIFGFSLARAGDGGGREPVTITVRMTQTDSSGYPILTVPAGKRFVGQAANCTDAGARPVPGGQCVLQANLIDGTLILLPLPPLNYDGVSSYPTVIQVMPFYLKAGTLLLGYASRTAPLQITVSGYFVKDKD
jgi:hypothetical protein